MVVVACSGKGMVVCLDDVVVELLDEGVVAWLDKNSKNNFDVYIRHRLDDLFEHFLLVHLLE